MVVKKFKGDRPPPGIKKAIKIIRSLHKYNLTPEQALLASQALQALVKLEGSTVNLPKLLTPQQVGQYLMVSPITVRAWAAKGKINARTTPGGHRRFPITEIQAIARRITQR